jgi:mRNA-degrading endonuclease YafQ of YafQ-DinJ toxin-antitoxin module
MRLTPDLRIDVSKQLKEEFENGRHVRFERTGTHSDLFR